jgi:plastocyanin
MRQRSGVAPGLRGRGLLLTVTAVLGALLVTSSSDAGRTTHRAASPAGVLAWGENHDGQLGSPASPARGVPAAVAGITGATAIAAGAKHSCAIAGGRVRCWGKNDDGQLGNGTTADSSRPVAVSGIAGATAVSAKRNYTCALASGNVRCWGKPPRVVSRTDALTPVTVSGLTNATAIAVGSGHVCAIVSGGTVRCWGDNSAGELGQGDGAFDNSATPLAVPGVSGAISIASGDFHTCVIMSGGTVRCWGYNAFAELGDGDFGDGQNSDVPMPVVGLTGAVAIAAGADHACAVRSGGDVSCWGYNLLDEVGPAGGQVAVRAVPVAGVTGAVAIAAGGHHSCALVGGGAARCWGLNLGGQLGGGSGETHTPTPVAVSGLAGATAIVAGDNHTLALAGQAGGAPGPGTTTRVTVVMREFRFSLSRTTVPHGRVTFTVVNRGRVGHDFAIAGRRTKVIGPRKTTTLTVTLKAGRFPYRCTVPGHAAAGMRGTLTVR